MVETTWIGFLIVIQGCFEVGQTIYCSYETDDGFLDLRYCPEECCEGEQKSYKDACCRIKYDSNIVVACGVIGLIVLSIFVMCFMYIACKRQLLKNARRSSARHYNTRICHSSRSTRRNVVLPTVSAQIEPVNPPPYKVDPPPYYTTLPSCIGQEESSVPLQGTVLSDPARTGADNLQAQKDFVAPSEPPPAYTVHDPSKS